MTAWVSTLVGELALSYRARAMLRAVNAGRAELSCSQEPDLFVDGVPCCDQFTAHTLAHDGLIAPAISGAIGQRVPAMETSLIPSGANGSEHVFRGRARRLRRLAPQLDWPSNVWMGVSVENEDAGVLSRVDELRRVPAAVRFLSCEPLLADLPNLVLDGISWVIVGGESGGGARPMQIRWAESLVESSKVAGAAVHVKQLGSVWARRTRRQTGAPVDPKGGDWEFWPSHLRIREFPEVASR
jgi:hypothetical protein